jgi:hypothetical protein
MNDHLRERPDWVFAFKFALFVFAIVTLNDIFRFVVKSLWAYLKGATV